MDTCRRCPCVPMAVGPGSLHEAPQTLDAKSGRLPRVPGRVAALLYPAWAAVAAGLVDTWEIGVVAEGCATRLAGSVQPGLGMSPFPGALPGSQGCLLG